jgi:hypothetical protein
MGSAVDVDIFYKDLIAMENVVRNGKNFSVL